MLSAAAILAAATIAIAICGCSSSPAQLPVTNPPLTSECIYTPSNVDAIQIADGAPSLTVNVALGISALDPSASSVYVRSVTVLLYGTPGVSQDKTVTEPVNKTIGRQTIVLRWPASGVLAQHTSCQVQGYTAG